MRTNYPRHLPDFNYTGPHQYSLTFCTFDRQHHFVDADTVTEASSQILRAAEEQHFAVIAYCFMPDHAHLIVEGLTADADLRRFISRAKQYSGYRFSKRTGKRLWQRYGFEHVVRDNECLQRLVRYVLENPVRKNLADSPFEYPFIGSSVYTLPELLEFAFYRGEREPGERGAGYS